MALVMAQSLQSGSTSSPERASLLACDEGTKWKSMRRDDRWRKWGHSEVVKIAQAIYDALPEAARHLVRTSWRGGSFLNLEFPDAPGVTLKDSKDCGANLYAFERSLNTNSAGQTFWTHLALVVQDLQTNFCFVRAVIQQYPDSIPSGFLLADAVLMMDAFFDGKLLQGDREMLALKIADRLKKMLQKLRELYRNSPHSYNKDIAELKQYLRKKSSDDLGALLSSSSSSSSSSESEDEVDVMEATDGRSDSSDGETSDDCECADGSIDANDVAMDTKAQTAGETAASLVTSDVHTGSSGETARSLLTGNMNGVRRLQHPRAP